MTSKVNKLGLDTSQGIDFTNDVKLESNKAEDLSLIVKQTNTAYSAKVTLQSGTTSSVFGQTYGVASYSFISGDSNTKKFLIGFDSIDLKNNSGVVRHRFDSSQSGTTSRYWQINDTLCDIISRNTSYTRWQLITKSDDTETGSNVGSDFGVYRYDDSGIAIDRPLWIYRNSGRVELSKIPVILESVSLTNNDNTGVTSRWVQQSNKSGGGKNFLFNPFFQVNQEANVSPKATGTGASGVYVLDGWKIKSTSGVSKSVTFTTDVGGGSVVLPDSATKLEQKILKEDLPSGVYVINPLVDPSSTGLTAEVVVYNTSGGVLSTTAIPFSKMTKKSSTPSYESNSSLPWGFGNLAAGLVLDLHSVSYSAVSIVFYGPGTVYGCQVEIGEVPTRVEARTFSDEVQRCKKFYQKSYEYSVVPGTITNIGATFYDFGGSNGYINANTFLEVSMRSIPTILTYSTVSANVSGVVTYKSSSSPSGANTSVFNIVNASSKYFNVGIGNNPTNAYNLLYHWVADARV